MSGEVTRKETNHFFFEITMRGRDLYFAKEWATPKKHYQEWEVHLIKDTFDGYEFLGSGGGGGGGGRVVGGRSPEVTALYVARNLWDKSGFVGATNENQTSKDGWHQIEVFQDLEQRGKYKIPRRILFTSTSNTQWSSHVWSFGSPENFDGDKPAVYMIKRIEFRNEPSPEWFDQMGQKYFSTFDHFKVTNAPPISASTNL
jgi:hypothetical protein